MKTGICAGTIYRALDVENLAASGGMNIQLIDFVRNMLTRRVTMEFRIKFLAEKRLKKHQMHKFTE